MGDRDDGRLGTVDSGWSLQGSAIRWAPGLVNIVSALAHHFCLAMPAASGARLLAEPCTVHFSPDIRLGGRRQSVFSISND